MSSGELPVGTVTFLFTDIEGSTKLLQRSGELYAELLADVHQYANALHALGVRRTDGVALLAPNCDELVTATLAAQLVGIAALKLPVTAVSPRCVIATTSPSMPRMWAGRYLRLWNMNMKYHSGLMPAGADRNGSAFFPSSAGKKAASAARTASAAIRQDIYCLGSNASNVSRSLISLASKLATSSLSLRKRIVPSGSMIMNEAIITSSRLRSP